MISEEFENAGYISMILYKMQLNLLSGTQGTAPTVRWPFEPAISLIGHEMNSC